MILHIESDGAHLTAPKARSRAGGYHYLGNKHDDMLNAPFHVLTKVMKHVTASAEETELGAICANAREGTIFRQALHGMGHTQKSTPVIAAMRQPITKPAWLARMKRKDGTTSTTSAAPQAQSPAQHRRLKSIAGFSSRRCHSAKEPFGSASQLQQLRPAPPYFCLLYTSDAADD